MPRGDMYKGIEKQKRLGYARMKAQAKYRKEPFYLTYHDYDTLWTDDKWANKGRSSKQLSMSRVDPESPWQTNNIIIETRQAYVKRILTKE